MINNVIFLDDTKTAIKVIYDTGSAQVMSWPSQNEELADFTEAAIELNTNEYLKRESWQAQQFDAFMQVVAENGGLDNVDFTEIVNPTSSSITPSELLTKEFTKEELFEYKLAVFELPEVKDAAAKSFRPSIRKAKDLVEVMYWLHKCRNPEED